MKLEIILEKGQARLASPVYLKADAPHRFIIEVSNDYIASSRDRMPAEFQNEFAHQHSLPEAKPGSLQAGFNEILGKFAHTRSGASIGDDHQTLLEALEQRYGGR